MNRLRPRAYALIIAASLGFILVPAHLAANVPNGILRHPGWWNWDVTFARRFPVPQLGPGAQVRLHLQIYNIFNLVQFTNLNTDQQFQDDPSVPGVDTLLLTSTTHARYTTTHNNIGTAAEADRHYAPAGLLAS